MKNFDPKDDKLKKLLEVKQQLAEFEDETFTQQLFYLLTLNKEETENVEDEEYLVYDKFRAGVNKRKKVSR